MVLHWDRGLAWYDSRLGCARSRVQFSPVPPFFQPKTKQRISRHEYLIYLKQVSYSEALENPTRHPERNQRDSGQRNNGMEHQKCRPVTHYFSP